MPAFCRTLGSAFDAECECSKRSFYRNITFCLVWLFGWKGLISGSEIQIRSMQVSKVSPHWHSILQSICAPLKLAIHVLKNLAGSGRTCRLAQSVAAVVAQKWIYPSTSVPLPCWYILARSAPQAIDSSANLCILMAGKFPHGQNTMRQRGRVPNSPQIC